MINDSRRDDGVRKLQIIVRYRVLVDARLFDSGVFKPL